MWPVSGEDQSLTVMGANGSYANFDLEAKVNWNVGGGVRLSFDIPGL